MKTLNKVKELGYEINIINYKHAASGVRIKRKGYALIKNNKELFTIEPHTSLGDKWLLHSKVGLSYHKNINAVVKEIVNQININHESN